MLGSMAGRYATDADSSVHVGYSAGYKATGINNIYLGSSAGQNSNSNYNIEIVTTGNAISILNNNDHKIHIENTIVGDTQAKKLAVGDVGASNLTPNATLEILTPANTDVGIIVKGAASQTDDLQQWQKSDGTIYSSVDATGNFDVNGMTSKHYKLHEDGYVEYTGNHTLTESDNGKVLLFTKGTAIQLEIPAGLTVGHSCTIIQQGAGQITFAAVAGHSTIIRNRQSHTKTAGQYARVGLFHYQESSVSNFYNLGGDTAP
jgi:hypothetical protein